MSHKTTGATNSRFTAYDSLMRYARLLGYGEIHTKIDRETGLHAIVAIHNTRRGPAIGGCRFKTYANTDTALEDVLRLGYMMSYKSAINHLPHGGAKSVLIKPKVIKDSVAYFQKFGEFLEEIGGSYITAMDSGTTMAEMDIIATKTKFVTCTSDHQDSDPSPHTAFGVRRGIEAAVKFQLGKDSLEGIHVAIQGAGNVGYHLAKQLHERGARLTVADINQHHLERCVKEFGAAVVSPDTIHQVKADVFAPCALGAVINKQTIHELQTSIVAGSANNQLAHQHYAELLHEKGILYAPDFLINAGGIIQVAVVYGKGTPEQYNKQIGDIYNTVYDIFEKSKQRDCSTHKIAYDIAHERLYG